MRLDPDIMAFPKLSYHSISSEHVALVNLGTDAQRFSVLPSSHTVHPTERGNHYDDWLTVRPAEGVVEPGQTVQLKVQARANVRLASRLMRGKQNVGATVVVRMDQVCACARVWVCVRNCVGGCWCWHARECVG